jgi:hypothetical protein
MRKNAGFMILTLLLLTVPALANAWTLAVKVAGGTDTKGVTVAYGTPPVSNYFKSTITNMYPVGKVTVTAAAGFQSMTLDDKPVVNGVLAPTSGNHTLSVTYQTTATTSGLILAQVPGGQIYAGNRNSTWTTDKVIGLVAGTIVPIAIAPDSNHKVTGYSVGLSTFTVSGKAAGEVVNVTAPADLALSTVTPVFALTAKTSVTLYAPTDGTTSNGQWGGPGTNPVVVSATATSNDSNLKYAFAVTGPASFSQAVSANQTFSFFPTIVGTYVVKATVTSDADSVGVVATAKINVTANQASVTQTCTSCHSTQSPAIVAGYATSIHNQSTESSCQGCHTPDAPHANNVNSVNVSPTTFVVLSSAANGVAKKSIFCTKCHNSAAGYPIPHPTTGQTMTCPECHGGGTDAHAIKAATIAPVVNSVTTDCSKCHAAENTNFNKSIHWITVGNAGYHYDTDPTVKNAEVIGPSCIYRCHFKASDYVPGSVPGDMTVGTAKGCATCHTGAITPAGNVTNPQAPIHDTTATSASTCEACHSGGNHGTTGTDFHASKHWNSSLEIGPEFAGGKVPGQINANESWTTTENGALTTCAYRCHFKPGMGPDPTKRSTGGITYTDPKTGTVYNRPTGDGCVACHDSHNPTASVQATCLACHSGSNHGKVPAAYFASVHATSPDFSPTEKTPYMAGKTQEIVQASCLACHNPHLPEATTYNASRMNAKIDVCSSCHNGIKAEGRKIGSVVHFASASTAATVAPSGLSYVGSAGRPVNSCSECHFNYDPHALAGFKNNSASQVLASWANSGHGSLNAETWKADDHRYKASNDFAGSTKGVTPENSAANFCVHCHTAKGLVEFITADSKHAIFTNISSVGDRTNWDASPLVCSGCHAPDANGATTSVVRTVPAAVGFYNVTTSSTNHLTAKISVKHQYANYGQSNLCMTCHVGAAGSGEVIKKAFAQNSNFAGSYVNPHHGYAGATLGQYGMYEYGDYTNLVNSHAAIGGTANGPCVSCHLKGTDHSLAAVSDVCVSCHGAGFTIDTAKANYQASLLVLKNALVANGLPIARAAATWGTGITGANNMGASMNYFNLSDSATDAAAYVHNPKYAKKVILDTIDWLAHGTLTGSISDVLAAQQTAGTLTEAQATQVTAAMESSNLMSGQAALSCAGCHNDKTGQFEGSTHWVTVANQGYHYDTNPLVPNEEPQETSCIYRCHFKASNYVAGSTPGDNTVGTAYGCATCHSGALAAGGNVTATPTAAHMTAETADNTCKVCHSGGKHEATTHATNHATATDCVACHNAHTLRVGLPHQNYTTSIANPNYRASYVTPRTTCATCHFAGPANDGNDTVRTAWKESGHGDNNGAAWKDSASHVWKNSGTAVNFQTTIPVNDCVRCHTANGFAAFATSGFTNVSSLHATDKDSEPLACNACHVSGAAARLAVPAVTTFYNVSTVDKTSKKTIKSRIQANFPDVGESNLCVSCHAARVNGPNLTALANSGNWDLSNTSFQNSHYDAAAGTMYMKVGFKNFTTLSAPAPKSFVGAAFASTQTYNQTLTALDTTTPDGVAGGQNSAHRRVGTALIAGSEDYLVAGGDPTAIATNGPCVTCHMKAYNPIAGNGFAADAVRSGAGHSLKIDEATAQQLCLPCHADAPHLDGGDGAGNGKYTTMANLADMEKAMMEPQKEAVQNGLNLVKQLLLVKYQIKYDSASYPYFYDMQKDATGKTAVTDWTRKNVAGVSNAAVLALGTANVTVIPTGGLTQTQAYRLMGACFNLNVLARDPGAYVHARTYTQRLVYDTVDFLDNNRMDFTPLVTARVVSPVAFKGTNVNVHASDGTLATESMAWLAGTHYNDTNVGNFLSPLRVRP